MSGYIKNKCDRERYVSNLEDINFILEQANDVTIIYNEEYSTRFPLSQYSYVNDNQRYIRVRTKMVSIDNETFKPGINTPCTFIFDKTGEGIYHIKPSDVLREYSKIYKPKNILKDNPDIFGYDAISNKCAYSARPIVGYNEKFDRTEHYVYCYDLNSAYSSVLIDKIIDTYNYRTDCVVKEDEVGFLVNKNITMVNSGNEADYVFKLIDSPYKDLVKKYYKIKKTAEKGSKQRQEAKEFLNIMVGLFQHTNPFLRAYVVNTCNNKIKNIINKHKDIACCWNTDAVYSTEPLDDIPIGDEIGEFKLEYEGRFRQLGNNYQKVDINDTTYRGVCKQSFKKDFNILTDELPENNDIKYRFDKSKNMIIANENFWQSLKNKDIGDN